MDLNGKHNHFETLTPKVQIIGQYEASGRILLLPISGNGNVTLTVGKHISRLQLRTERRTHIYPGVHNFFQKF
jgi:hypothetical protein